MIFKIYLKIILKIYFEMFLPEELVLMISRLTTFTTAKHIYMSNKRFYKHCKNLKNVLCLIRDNRKIKEGYIFDAIINYPDGMITNYKSIIRLNTNCYVYNDKITHLYQYGKYAKGKRVNYVNLCSLKVLVVNNQSPYNLHVDLKCLCLINCNHTNRFKITCPVFQNTSLKKTLNQSILSFRGKLSFWLK